MVTPSVTVGFVVWRPPERKMGISDHQWAMGTRLGPSADGSTSATRNAPAGIVQSLAMEGAYRPIVPRTYRLPPDYAR